MSKKRGKRDYDEEDEFTESYSSDSFDSEEIDIDEDEVQDSIKSEENFNEGQKKLLRRFKNELEIEQEMVELRTNKKSKKQLTEDDIIKKNDLVLKRKLQAKKMLEEEKRQTIEKILNEDGRKLKERQRKLNEDAIKKEQLVHENFQLSLTKIKLKFQRDGKIFLRFPQGLMLPKVLMQKANSNQKYPEKQKCGVLNCQNLKKYKDPITKTNYCSLNCYQIIKNSLHVN